MLSPPQSGSLALVIVESAAAAMLARVLGARHGLDADHLAAIDGLTRWNASAGRRVAPLCGVMFLTGHAAVIVATALALVVLAGQLAPLLLAGRPRTAFRSDFSCAE